MPGEGWKLGVNDTALTLMKGFSGAELPILRLAFSLSVSSRARVAVSSFLAKMLRELLATRDLLL